MMRLIGYMAGQPTLAWRNEAASDLKIRLIRPKFLHESLRTSIIEARPAWHPVKGTAINPVLPADAGIQFAAKI